MLKPLRTFIKNPKPSKAEALGVLRANFALMFLAQTLVAATVALIVSLVSEQQSSSVLVTQILLMVCILQLPLGISLPLFSARFGGKGAALSASIFMAVLLSSSAWFVAFAFVIGSPFVYLFIMFVLLISYYNVGFFLCGNLANLALIEPQTP